MKDFKQIVKKNKRKALSIAVAAAFFVSGRLDLQAVTTLKKKMTKTKMEMVLIIVAVGTLEGGIVLAVVHL